MPLAALTAEQRRRFADLFLRTMDPDKAGRALGRDDGAALLCRRDVQAELRRQREGWSGQFQAGDVLRRMAAIAFGRANDCVRLALEPDCDVSALDLTLLSEIRRSEKGLVEVKLCDRLAALQYLAQAAEGKKDPAAEFLEALNRPPGDTDSPASRNERKGDGCAVFGETEGGADLVAGRRALGRV